MYLLMKNKISAFPEHNFNSNQTPAIGIINQISEHQFMQLKRECPTPNLKMNIVPMF